MKLERYAEDHADALWAILEPMLRAGETYCLPRDMGRAAALAYWCDAAHEVWMAGDGLGTCYLRANQAGGGDHVCNAAFVTAPGGGGKGVARAMLEHALDRARERGFAAMQFNFVVASNTRALKIWADYGFDIVGRVPQAFRHPAHGMTDALILHRFL
ncbi:GNAT family N-acetyltransferase [Maribius pontilimi]|uniref:GNAT family N-acetyltransferase n=1 Tax=Palleronia pontilimi TaxID=1964209 RepID=A0A934IIM8_9RHOB|nr:GNAT family N-acetyltransferase [Palleronia pontilimi]MBJ3763265.1 GNAT family N-acetyltransferase [Palleronia pontilimi]